MSDVLDACRARWRDAPPLSGADLIALMHHSPYEDVRRLVAEILRIRDELALRSLPLDPLGQEFLRLREQLRLAHDRVRYEQDANERLREAHTQERAVGRTLSTRLAVTEREVARLTAMVQAGHVHAWEPWSALGWRARCWDCGVMWEADDAD